MMIFQNESVRHIGETILKIGYTLEEVGHLSQTRESQWALRARQNVPEYYHYSKIIYLLMGKKIIKKPTLILPLRKPFTFTIVTIPESLREVEFFNWEEEVKDETTDSLNVLTVLEKDLAAFIICPL